MSKPWPKVKLGEVLRRVSRDEVVEATSSYRMLGVRLDGQGPFLREVVTGGQTSANKLSRVSAGDFIYSRLFAWRGAFGIIGPELDGCYVSGEFPTFLPDSRNLDLRFLRYWFRLRTTLDAVDENCSGSTPLTRNRFKEEFFLSLQVPLPPLAEQKRIVARIEEIAAHINEAHELRRQAVEEAEAFDDRARSKFFEHALKRGAQPLSEIAALERGKFSHRPRNDPRFFGGAHPWIQIAEIERSGKYIRDWSQTLNDNGLSISKKFPKGTLLISIAATIGAVGILEFDCCVPDSIVGVTPRDSVDDVDSEFLYHYLSYVRTHLEKIAPQSAQKNINLQILSPLPVPRIDRFEQQRIVAELNAVQAEVDALKRLQADTAAELDALLPSVLNRAFAGEL